ncbi:ribonuclease H-like domain-containing protein [Tanacetum coccineum]|uniref:Ribonuclease H-like domain-containing protein n=1 Tax=Tanacetum coccineum TaxID=301880 RepID=A0ABQ4ZDZ8_9ASTR
MSEFCKKKGIKKEFSVARTPQQNGVAERRNRTLIEAARTILMKAFFVGYSMNSKAFRVYNIRTRKVEENLHIRFLEDKPIIAGDGPKWLFDIDVLTKSMNYVPVVVESPMKNSTQDVNTTRPSINTANTSVNTGSLNINVVSPTVTTAPLEATHSVYKQGGMIKTTNKQGFISAVYEGKTHEDLHTCLFACFLSHEEPKKVVAQGYTSRKRNRLYDEMDVKSAFLYGKIEEEVYVCQPLGFEDPEFPDRVYKVEKALYGLFSFLELGMMTLANISWIMVFREMSSIEVWFSTVKTTSTPMETSKPLMKDENAEDIDVHLYRSMIGSLMYLTSSRPVIMFAIMQCKIANCRCNSTTKAEYVAAASCYGQVLWIQNQMLDYGYNFMNTKIFINNESTICIVKNPVFHSKTKHIEIRHHFIRDSNEKKLIQLIKIHTD